MLPAPNIHLDDESATLQLGAALSHSLAPGLVVFLRGELGAGKTTVVRGALRALGFEGRVKSPTYALVELYAVSRLNLHHFDFYRFNDPREWIDAGFRDSFNGRDVSLVEWPEKAAGLLPPADLEISLQVMDSGRDATIHAGSPAGERALAAMTPHLPSSAS